MPVRSFPSAGAVDTSTLRTSEGSTAPHLLRNGNGNCLWKSYRADSPEQPAVNQPTLHASRREL